MERLTQPLKENFMPYNKLTSEEARIIEDKGTEAPYSGEYEKHFADGVYLCRRCDAPLYDSRDKFDAHCGWPSFDDEVPGAIHKSLDADGYRTEIQCAKCGAHLGHVFIGEQLTPKDTRHCVNSLSMRFIPRDFTSSSHTAVLGGGCFWCLEAAYENIKGVLSVVSGYAGGLKSNPSYEEVSSGQTGYAEVVQISFDPSLITYRQILEIFFTIHDPTTLNRQGHDIGTQYRSVIFYETWAQKKTAEAVLMEMENDKIYADKIVTELKPLNKFYPAEEYHQHYYAKHPELAYCQAVIAPKLAKLRGKYQALLK